MGMGEYLRMRVFASKPFPQRLSAQDTLEWFEGRPALSDNYMSFWSGNQLPGTHVITPPHAYYVNVSSQYDTQPVRPGGIFSQQLGQLNSADLIARWRAAWANARGQYS